jgi:hypothetical protein
MHSGFDGLEISPPAAMEIMGEGEGWASTTVAGEIAA